MDRQTKELVQRLMAAVETPGDLSATEVMELLEDAQLALGEEA